MVEWDFSSISVPVRDMDDTFAIGYRLAGALTSTLPFA